MKAENRAIQPENSRKVYCNLLIGRWKCRFSLEQLKLFLVENLNYCVEMEGLRITGYFITGRRLFLILKCIEDESSSPLEGFYKQVRQQLRNRWQEFLYYKEVDAGNRDVEIFREDNTVNEVLVKLITGEKVRLDYYSPGVAKLKNYIQNYKYSSALDYSGGKGPVILEWQREEESRMGLT